MDLTDDAAIRACRKIKRILFVLCRYPLFTRDYIRENIEKPDTKPSEQADYKSNCLHSKLCFAALLMSIYLWNSVKNFYIIYLWLNSFNYSQHSDNLKEFTNTDYQLSLLNYQLAAGETLTRVSCLITNCTRLSAPGGEATSDGQEQLLTDMSHLPLFMMCNPKVDAFYYTPVTRLGAFGILAFVVTMYTHFLLGCWPTIQQMLRPTYDDMLMFISSPHVSQQIVLRRCRALLHDVALSYHNFCLSLLSATSGHHAQTRMSLPLSDSRDIWRHAPKQPAIELINGKLNSSLVEPFDASSPGLGASKCAKQSDPAEFKCLPTIYTQWWRTRAARIMVNSVCLCLLGVAQIGATAILLIQYRLDSQSKLLHQFDQETRLMDCLIWPETSKSLKREQSFRLADVQLHWTLFSLINATGLTTIASSSILIMFSTLWMELVTINLWVAEIRMLLVASLLATQQRHEHERCLADSEANHRAYQRFQEPLLDTRSFFDISNLRKHFQESINPMVFTLYRRVPSETGSNNRFAWRLLNSKCIDRDHETRFKAQILALNSIESPQSGGELPLTEECQTNYNTDTLDAIYVNFRLLIEYIDRMRMVTGLVVVVSYLLNYGYLLLAIICWRKLATSSVDTNFIVFFAISISSGLIFLCASFHSNAKRLQPLLHSLIAQLTYSSSLRLKHMRSLLMRMTLMLDNAGGMALSTYGHRITYVYIIRLMIGTATVVVLALKPHV